MTTSEPDLIPDDKDWTWTLERTCPDCGYAASSVPGEAIAGEIRRLTAPWGEVLAKADVRQRPRPAVWSPLEYGAHVRDVCRLFAGRLALMLAHDAPQFANWDQDVTAVEDDYAGQDPGAVSTQLAEAGQSWAMAYAAVTGEQWGRRGIRSNGSEFTVLTLGQYGLHDLAHHVWDVGADAQR